MQAPLSVLQIALPVPLPRLFDYLPPPGIDAASIAAGQRVRVPFGNRELVGLVAGHYPGRASHELRTVMEVVDEMPLLTGELLASLRWLAQYLHAPLGEVMATALPALLRRGEPVADTSIQGWRLTAAGCTALPAMRGGKPQALAALLRETRSEAWLETTMPGWRAALRTLRDRGLVERCVLDAASVAPLPTQKAPILNDEQRVATEAIRAASGFSCLLLDGVTGSGKTEVYLNAIADCLARGRQALVLVPEIGLTPQALARFRARLGVPVHALHSGLGDSARARTWAEAWRGQARVIVGTRSAVFVPLPEAGLIVVDEEHDGSYKQFDGIRYHARDFAVVRARALDVPILLGSATPSLESLHNARAGRYTQLRLRHRAGNAKPPVVRVIDIRKRPLQAGLGTEALDAIGAALQAGGQVLVFKNRRGYAPVLHCHDCGWSAHCPRCSTPEHATPMTVHGAGRRLQCHHCGTRKPVPLACPDCASLALQPQGAGTERIEEMLAERFGGEKESVRAERSEAQPREVDARVDPSTPALRAYAQGERRCFPVVRIDRGSTQRRDALEKHFETLGNRPGILVGTQMLAKGHDLPNLTLVVVVGVDEGLYSADFRSGEKLAQLLVQVAGRAGRADKPGHVLVQTHHPDHPLLHTLIGGGYHACADAELMQREAAGFPPFAHLALLRAEAKHADPPMQFLQAAKDLLVDIDLEISGPLPAPMPRRAGYQRAQLVLSSPLRSALHGALDALVPALHAAPDARKVRWSLDVDPVELY